MQNIIMIDGIYIPTKYKSIRKISEQIKDVIHLTTLCKLDKDGKLYFEKQVKAKINGKRNDMQDYIK